MSHITSTLRAGLSDDIGRRLRWAMIASLLLNLLLWRAVAAIAKHPAFIPPRPVEITRVIIDNKGRKIPKIVTPKQIKQKIAQIRRPRPIQKPPPQPRREARRPQPPKPVQIARRPPPQGAHLHVITALPDKHAPPPQPDDHTALADGNAKQGVPIDKQNLGNATANPPEPAKTQPAPNSNPAPQPQPPPAPAPVHKEEPAPPPEVKPAPPEPPKPRGPTKDAEPENQVQPAIPDDLKNADFKTFVRVKVEVEADGSFTPILRTSSGNTEIDNLVLEALKKWKWKPALKDGVPVKSTQLFKFEFEVN
ncbi:MAG TPA: TonB family protein [Chthonomonadaceae bacterium]|nr:TonB family protein [Chthonomonadaceae bacterium]